jgi:hypothetical protein
MSRVMDMDSISTNNSYSILGPIPKFKGADNEYQGWKKSIYTYLIGRGVHSVLRTEAEKFGKSYEELFKQIDDNEFSIHDESKEEDDDIIKKNDIIKKYVKNSNIAYSILMQSLNDSIKLLVNQVTPGYAYGVWQVLENKYQNTDVLYTGIDKSSFL